MEREGGGHSWGNPSPLPASFTWRVDKVNPVLLPVECNGRCVDGDASLPLLQNGKIFLPNSPNSTKHKLPPHSYQLHVVHYCASVVHVYCVNHIMFGEHISSSVHARDSEHVRMQTCKHAQRICTDTTHTHTHTHTQ